MRVTTLIALIALHAMPGAAQVPADLSEEPSTWKAVKAINTEAAYALYLRRFPDGQHVQDAASRVSPSMQPERRPQLTMAQAQALAAEQQRDVCLSPAEPPSADVAAFRAARAGDQPASFQQYLAAHPQGACANKAKGYLSAMEARRSQLAPVPGIGPLPARRLPGIIFSNDDYPLEAWKAKAAGSVTAEWDVSELGYVQSCRVTRSSGSPVLDAKTCSIVTRRMRYDPARDGQGAVARSTDHLTMHWTLPS